MTISKKQQALLDYRDGDDLLMLAADALIDLEPNLACFSDATGRLVLGITRCT